MIIRQMPMSAFLRQREHDRQEKDEETKSFEEIANKVLPGWNHRR